ncbi:MAG: FAD-dependent oxidoreductase [Chlamydiia bacterium]|jgi:thioredoxin reductase (NADPH)
MRFKAVCRFTLSLLLASCSFTTLHTEEIHADSQSAVIIGGGVGALTSAIFLARSGIKSIVILGKNPGGALSQSSNVQNWPGEYDIVGIDLMKKIRDQAEKNGVLLLDEEVISVDFSQKPFKIVTQNVFDPKQNKTLQTRACIIATGSEARRLYVQGEDQYWNRGVYTCAICDGSLYQGKTVAVVGGGDAALAEAEYLSQIAKKVFVIVRKNTVKGNEKKRHEALLAAKNVEFIMNAEVKAIQGVDGVVKEVVIEKEAAIKILPLDAVFLAIGSVPNTQIFAGQVQINDQGYIVKDDRFQASVPGVYAVGDATDPLFKQAITAAGDGARAALGVTSYLFQSGAVLPSSSEVSKESADAKVEKAVAAIAVETQAETLSKAEQFPGSTIEITSFDQFSKEVTTSSIPVLIDFYASWCGPCRHISPKIEKYAATLQGKCKIVKVNVQHVAEIADLYSIRSMPTLVSVNRDGKEIERRSGVSEILAFLESFK